MSLTFIDLKEEDLHIVKEIYDYYILNSTATFHTLPITIEELKSTIPIGSLKYNSFIVYYQNKICGYCYLSRYKPRQAYDRTAEITVYLKPEFTGKGLGSKILHYVEQIAKKNDICVLLGIITAENKNSVKLFSDNGYEKCAHLKNVGEKNNKILDVVFYQKIL